MNIYGELPTNDVVFAACDAKYLKEHGQAFVYSLDALDKDVHIHVVNPDEDTFSFAALLNATTIRDITFSFNDISLEHLSEDERRTYCACLRFIVAPIILQTANSLLIVDIDCFFMKDFDLPERPVAYFPRESLAGTTGWEQEGTRVAAGAVYFHRSAHNIAEKVSVVIRQLHLQWFADQIALSRVLGNIDSAFVDHFDSKFLDWEFEEDTVIWTGKGPRKHSNAKYLHKRQQLMLLDSRLEKIDTVILAPRLDCSFKNTGVFVKQDSYPEIREHWKNFIVWIAQEVRALNKNVLIVQSPNWMFNNTIQNYFHKHAQFYVPHTDRERFKGNGLTKYYMQTVFPHLFTVDPKGWSGGAQFVETFDREAEYSPEAFNEMEEWAVINENSKFAQPQKKCAYFDIDIFVPLQLPHDLTIKYHSDISVEEFVTKLCEWSKETNKTIMFKGHPVNIESMKPLKEIIHKYSPNARYVEDIHIHDLIKSAKATYVINSGVGQEAMLFQKPVVCFGRCEYEAAVIKGDINNLSATWKSLNDEEINFIPRVQMYMRWYDWYINRITIDTRFLLDIT